MHRWLLGGYVVVLTLCSAPLVAQDPNWTLKVPTDAPTPRTFHAMAYDAARAQVVLFGGIDSNFVSHNDTWVWDGTNWTQKSPANSPPPSLSNFMAYDAARAQVVLFGGRDSNFVDNNDTWVWDGTNWTQKSPANSPTPRSGNVMEYDAARAQVVLFGGVGSNNVRLNDTWVWDGTNWTQKSPANSPPLIASHAMAYDAARAQVVLFGGLDGQILQDEHPLENRDDTWVWDGTNWTQKSPANSPPPRGYLAMAYDAARAQVVLFGGINSNNFVRYNDTWVWPSDSGGGGTIVVLPLSLSFTYQEGDFGPIVPQPLAVSGTGGPIGFTTFASTTSGGNWLSVTPTNDTTPSTLSVSVAPGLLAGTYNGEITILSGVASNSPQHVDVTLTSLDKKDFFLTAPVKKPDPTREYAFNLGDVSERCIANSVDYFHTGIDYVNKNILKDKKKLPDVLAAAAGRVIIPKEGGSACDGPVPESGFKNHGLGNVVILEHSTGDGVLYTLYGHLSKITVASGKEVKQGEKIGEMGNTCTSDIHLHFELKSEGVPENPDDAPCGIGTCYPAAGQSCWGYTLGWPDAFGYSDPAPFIK